MANKGAPRLNTAMITIDALGGFKAVFFVKIERNLAMQRLLIDFEGKQVICAFAGNGIGDISLTPHRSNGDKRSGDLQFFQQARDGGDLVFLAAINNFLA